MTPHQSCHRRGRAIGSEPPMPRHRARCGSSIEARLPRDEAAVRENAVTPISTAPPRLTIAPCSGRPRADPDPGGDPGGQNHMRIEQRVRADLEPPPLSASSTLPCTGHGRTLPGASLRGGMRAPVPRQGVCARTQPLAPHSCERLHAVAGRRACGSDDPRCAARPTQSGAGAVQVLTQRRARRPGRRTGTGCSRRPRLAWRPRAKSGSRGPRTTEAPEACRTRESDRECHSRPT